MLCIYSSVTVVCEPCHNGESAYMEHHPKGFVQDHDEVGPTKAHLDDSIPEVQLISCLIQEMTHLHRVAV